MPPSPCEQRAPQEVGAMLSPFGSQRKVSRQKSPESWSNRRVLVKRISGQATPESKSQNPLFLQTMHIGRHIVGVCAAHAFHRPHLSLPGSNDAFNISVAKRLHFI